jgi:hypothetical protein
MLTHGKLKGKQRGLRLHAKSELIAALKTRAPAEAFSSSLGGSARNSNVPRSGQCAGWSNRVEEFTNLAKRQVASLGPAHTDRTESGQIRSNSLFRNILHAEGLFANFRGAMIKQIVTDSIRRLRRPISPRQPRLRDLAPAELQSNISH